MADKSITNRKSSFCAGRPSFLTGNGARAAFVIKTNGQLVGRFFRAFEVKALTKYPMRNFVMPKKKFKKKGHSKRHTKSTGQVTVANQFRDKMFGGKCFLDLKMYAR